MDYTIDQNPRPLYRIDELVGTPEYVEQAAVITKEATAGLAQVAFAHPTKREFPCFNKVSTYLSYAYLMGSTKSPDARLVENIKTAATAFGITADLEKIDAALANVKSASTPEMLFALPAGSVEKHADTNFYPLNDVVEVEASAHQLLNDRARMPAGLFHKAALAIVKAAANYSGCVLPAKVAAAGVDRYPDFEYATKIAANRKFVVKQPEALELYADLVKVASASDAEAEKIASLWEELDQSFGVKYEDGIVDPYAAIYSGTPKAEVEKLATEVVLIADVPVPVSVISRLPEEGFAQRFSAKTAAALVTWVKSASVFKGPISAIGSAALAGAQRIMPPRLPKSPAAGPAGNITTPAGAYLKTASALSETIATFPIDVQKEVLRMALAAA